MQNRIKAGLTVMKLGAALVSVSLSAQAWAVPVDITDLVGQYAHYDVVSYDDPQLFGTMRSQVITYGITAFALDGDELIETDTFCHAEHTSNLPVRSEVPDSFTRAIVPRVAPVMIGDAGQGWDLWRPETPTGIGVKFEDSVAEDMPKDADDPRIADDDGDGHPGVTVFLRSGPIRGQLYLARRERFAYELRVITPDLIQGVVHDQSEQLVLGSRPFFLSHGRFNPVQNPDLTQSPITLRRLPAGYDCDTMMAERAKWFP
ncbi:MAG: hypothetical protein FJ146_17405 [Deltaproteobacteria bacterium]|nr:hypothetical protein [Deltaproteobacteria bacterium]